ncbi:RrF2 family transcriptional regulator [Pelagibacterium xiamenense]|uniref:RrF2 family transcriptional regulator n=1 Tax=Pelagibacterium xiamenense TaxID=2901140 RepID=UPI001E522DAF|nr:Rrf2 family transcriptional regulator [Pelagibacterium xiamenense]MCD7060264.1 Rrf2 family transcriptional regulator [Pelagibacterium xiamenense]
MRRDTKLSAALHALLHMVEQDEPMTSAELALCMSTNPVVVRRTMAGLREAGIVRSTKGAGGGWEMARDLAKVTLMDVYEALGSPRLLALGLGADNPDCLVEVAVNDALADAFAEAEARLVSRFGAVTLAALSQDFHGRLDAHYADHKR